ncbi:MAG: VPLPA-CTERM sorting domain-containing protein, partial [Gammaproteobacteria bacterium]|nr:VPLPA-CTERM sorting domain-containing protein [Gammaproteobacteria bacterium]
FFGDCTQTYFSPSSYWSDYAAPSISLEEGTADMGAFHWMRCGTEFNLGNMAIVINNLDGTYTLEWSAIVVGGPFDGLTTEWTMDIRPVPLPAAFWLFASGLIGLFGFARKTRK